MPVTEKPETNFANLAERIHQGRESGTHAKGGIVPFPPTHRGRDILDLLSGKDRQKVGQWIAGGFKPTVYEYCSAEGEVIQAVLRFDHPTEQKEIRPLRYLGKDKQGQHLTWLSPVEAPRPLYGLDRLASRPDAPVLVVEGEKAADAAQSLFPECVAITWAGGASSVPKTEMLALEGRRITIWPDNDSAGRKAGLTFAALALKAGAKSAAFVDVPGEFGEKWDLADEVPAAHREDYPLERLLATARPLSAGELGHLSGDAREKAAQRRLLGHKPGHSKVDQAAVKAALSELDPGMLWPKWMEVARCLYLAFAESGLVMFDEWSAGCAEKYRKDEPAKLWEEFKTEPNAFRAKSLAWLLRKARDLPRDEGKNFEVDLDAFVRASIEEVNEDHAVVTRGAKIVIMWEQYDPRFERYSLLFLKKSDFIDKLIWKIPLPPEEGDKAGKKKSKPLGALWCTSGARQQFEAIYFAPGQTLGRKDLNTWTGFTVEPRDHAAGWSKLKDHIFENIAQRDPLTFNYIMNWLAFGVQHLDRPVGTALVLQGAKGAGKSILIVLYGYLFGPHTWVTAISEDIIGRFNAHLETTLLLGVEEAFAPQNRAADGTLKDLITSKTLRVEDKFFSAWAAPSHLRIIMTSNNDQVVRADGSDRRYAVFEVINPHQNDPDARRRYFGELVEQMENGGYEAMLGELLGRDITAWNPEAIPETEALKRQKRLNLSNDPVTAWYYSRLEDGIDILSGEGGTNVYAWGDSTVWVPVQDVLADYSAFAKRHGHRGDDQRLKSKLARFMPPGFESKAKAKMGVNGSRAAKCYPFPPLAEARRIFTERTGHPVGDPD